MALTEKPCANPACGMLFVGRANKHYCSDHCRWRKHSATHYEAVRSTMPKVKDPEAQRRGKANRAKGARVEREVCHLIRDLTGDDVSRNLSQTRDAGGDVKWGPFYLEVKYQQTLALPAWQRQATESAAKDVDQLVPAVVYRRPNEHFWVAMPFHTFVMMFDMMRKRIAELERGQEANAAIQATVDQVAPE